MKNQISFFSFVLIIALSFSSCSKDDDGGSDKLNYFACKLNGVEWVSQGVDQPTVVRAVVSGVASKRLDFFGSDGTTQISITVQDYQDAEQGACMTENTYYGLQHAQAADNYMTSGGLSNFAQLSVSGNSLARDGWVKITKCDDSKISGTFAFEVKDLLGAVVLSVTEGHFDNVEYTFSE